MPRKTDERSLIEFIKQQMQERNPAGARRETLDITGGGAASLQKALTLIRRRDFIVASSVAAGALLIKPLGVAEAEGGFWKSLREFFMAFGTNMLFSFLTQGGPSGVAGFGGLSQAFLSPLLQLVFAGGCFGNLFKAPASPTPTPTPLLSVGTDARVFSRRQIVSFTSPSPILGNPVLPPSKVLALVGNSSRLNAGAAYLNKDNSANRIIFPGQSYIGITDVAKGVLENKDNLPQSSETADAIKQRYYLPRWDGQFGRIAQETTSNLQPFTRPFSKPQFFESESGALVLVTYDSQITRTDGSGKPKAGQGRSVVYTVPPGERKEQVLEFISKKSNFWANDAVRGELMGVMEDNLATGGGVESHGYAFEAQD